MFKIKVSRINFPKWDGKIPITEHMLQFCKTHEEDLREGLDVLNAMTDKILIRLISVNTSDDPTVGWTSEYLAFTVETKDEFVSYFTNRVNELTLLRDTNSTHKTVVEVVEL